MDISDMKLTGAHCRIVAVASMEQIIGAGLSTVVGIMIPLLAIARGSALPAFLQGVLGATGLIGIALGSMILGNLSDRYGYLFYFRLCPVLIFAGAMLVWLTSSVGWLIAGLFVTGFGVGGGYSLDTDYISELMPRKWQSFMVGVAKATSSLGFFATAGISYLILKHGFKPEHWSVLMLIIAALGLLTLLVRIRFRNSPRWLLAHGYAAKAQSAARFFFGSDATVSAPPAEKGVSDPEKTSDSLASFFEGDNLKKVIFSGIPWACEGVGVYGVGVFLPLLVAALGIAGSEQSAGLTHVVSSVELTAVINFFILPGFVLGLMVVERMSLVKMLSGGFFISAVGLTVLLVAYLLKWPVWISVAAFVIFEIFLNAGPHLVTFIIPAKIYSVANRGTGSGIAAMIGKTGAILGVFFMPLLLKWGGITLVLCVCIAVSVIGALISLIYGRIVLK